MRSAGLLALTIGGAALAFLSLLLVVPFLVANTGVGGFIVGFVVSLIPAVRCAADRPCDRPVGT